MHKVVMPFPCSWDGITSVLLAVGEERDFGTMADGLIGMGWIEPIDVEVVTKPVVAVETVAEREVSVDLLPIETAEEVVVETAVEGPFEMAIEQPTFETPRRGRKRK